MPQTREKFATQVNAEILAAIRMIAEKEGRQLQALVDEALAEYTAEFNPMPPPRYHPERIAPPAPLWANRLEMGQSIRIPPAADAMNDARRMEITCTARPGHGTYDRSITPRCFGAAGWRVLLGNAEFATESGPGIRT